MEFNPDSSGQRGGGRSGNDSNGKFGFDLNIDNYSTDDLLDIYKINKRQKGNITEDYVKKTTNDIIQQYKNYNANGIGGDMPFSENYNEDDQYIWETPKCKVLSYCLFFARFFIQTSIVAVHRLAFNI
jgi:hypothetical protein